jgi:hypothetical protein
MAFLGSRMIWEFGYRRSKVEKIYRRTRTVYTIANTKEDLVLVEEGFDDDECNPRITDRALLR